MAKKRPRRDQPEVDEDYEFQEPDFDEAGFIKEEVSDTWGAVLLVVSALPAGYLSYLVANLLGTGWAGFVLAIGWYLGVYYLFSLVNLTQPLSKFKKSLGTGALFMFAWLGFWVLFFNVPFADVTPPSIASPEVGVWSNGTMTWTPIGDQEQWDLNVTTNGSYMLHVRTSIADNSLEEPSVAFGLASRCGSQLAVPTPQVSVAGDLYNVTIDLGSLASTTLCADGYDLTITAEDGAGNAKTHSDRVLFVPSTV